MSKLLRPALLCGVLITSLSLAGDIKTAPDFNLDQYKGEKLSLSQLKGQVVLINFWASWCIPCKEEMPLLDQMYRKHKPMGFTLLGVNVEPESAKAEALLQQKPVSFPVLFDRQSQVSKLYNVAGMPTSVLIDRNGNVRYLHKGYKPGDENTYLDQIRALRPGIEIGRVLDVPVHVAEDASYEEQVARIVQGVGLTSRDWQTLPILVNPPGFAPVASILLAYLHGLRGSFPELLRIARDPSSGGYIVAAIIDLQTVRESGRISRWEGADL